MLQRAWMSTENGEQPIHWTSASKEGPPAKMPMGLPCLLTAFYFFSHFSTSIRHRTFGSSSTDMWTM